MPHLADAQPQIEYMSSEICFVTVDCLLSTAAPINGVWGVKMNEQVRQASAAGSTSGDSVSFTHRSRY